MHALRMRTLIELVAEAAAFDCMKAPNYLVLHRRTLRLAIPARSANVDGRTQFTLGSMNDV